MRILMSSLIVVTLLVATGTAHAQPSATETAPPASPATHTERYGWKTGLVDLAAIGTAALGLVVFLSQLEMGEDAEGAYARSGSDGAKLAMVAGGIYVLGAPIVHSLHGNSTGAAKSFAVRVGLPLVGVLAGAATDGDTSTALVIAAVPTAMIIDAVLFAQREVRAPRVTPFAAPVTGGGVTIGVVGGF